MKRPQAPDKHDYDSYDEYLDAYEQYINAIDHYIDWQREGD